MCPAAGMHLVERMTPEKRAEFIEQISNLTADEDTKSLSSNEGEQSS